MPSSHSRVSFTISLQLIVRVFYSHRLYSCTASMLSCAHSPTSLLACNCFFVPHTCTDAYLSGNLHCMASDVTPTQKLQTDPTFHHVCLLAGNPTSANQLTAGSISYANTTRHHHAGRLVIPMNRLHLSKALTPHKHCMFQHNACCQQSNQAVLAPCCQYSWTATKSNLNAIQCTRLLT